MSKHRASTPVDDLQEIWTRISEKNKARYRDFEKDYCQGFEDGMDGFVIHSSECSLYQRSSVSSNRCINYRSDCDWPVGLSDIR